MLLEAWNGFCSFILGNTFGVFRNDDTLSFSLFFPQFFLSLISVFLICIILNQSLYFSTFLFYIDTSLSHSILSHLSFYLYFLSIFSLYFLSPFTFLLHFYILVSIRVILYQGLYFLTFLFYFSHPLSHFTFCLFISHFPLLPLNFSHCIFFSIYFLTPLSYSSLSIISLSTFTLYFFIFQVCHPSFSLHLSFYLFLSFFFIQLRLLNEPSLNGQCLSKINLFLKWEENQLELGHRISTSF